MSKLLIITLLYTISNPLYAYSNQINISLQQSILKALTVNRTLTTQNESVTTSLQNLEATKSNFDLKITPSGSAGIQGGTEATTSQQYKAGVTLSKKLPWGTTVTSTPSMTKMDGNQDAYQSEIGVSINQPLLRGLGQEFAMASVYGSEYSVRSARRNYFLAQVRTVLQVVRNVYSILNTQEQVSSNAESLSRLQELTKVAKIKLNVGVAEPEDVFRAEQQLKQAESNLIASKRSLQQLQDELKTMLSLDQSIAIDVTAPLTIPALDIEPEKALKSALENRMELEQTEDDLRERYRASRIARDNTLPELNIALGYNRVGRSEDLGDSTSMDHGTWGINLVSSTDVFRTTEKIAYKQSLVAIEQGKRSIAELKDSISKEVKETFRKLRESHQNIELQQERMVNARQQLELSRIKFKHGMANNFDLLDAESVFTSARHAYQTAITNAIVGSYELQAAMGTLFEDLIKKPTYQDVASYEPR